MMGTGPRIDVELGLEGWHVIRLELDPGLICNDGNWA